MKVIHSTSSPASVLPNNTQPPKSASFTAEADGRLGVLTTPVHIFIAFRPGTDPEPESESYTAIWDTGATHSVINQTVVKDLGLAPIAITEVYHAQGKKTDANVYLVNIGLPNGVGFPNIRVTEGDLHGADVLIGMDIIGRGDFAVSNYQGRTCFSYRYPSLKKIDFNKELAQQTQSDKIGRNSPCPCGSGNKYKHCCGSVK